MSFILGVFKFLHLICGWGVCIVIVWFSVVTVSRDVSSFQLWLFWIVCGLVFTVWVDWILVALFETGVLFVGFVMRSFRHLGLG